MYLASAYPNSAISAAALMVIAFVMAGALALWLGLVFLADRKSSGAAARRADTYLAVVAQPDAPAEDEHSEARHDSVGHQPIDHGRSGHRQGAAV